VGVSATSEPWPAEEQRSVWAGIGLILGLLLAMAGCVLAAYSINETYGPSIAYVAMLLYPGLAGLIAARSRSSDAVVAAATLLPSLGFWIVVPHLMGLRPGSPAVG